MNPASIVRVTFKQQMLQAREEAIVKTVNRLLAEKGFEAMTVDEVAAQVGIAKASLYKHFASKEALAVAAMLRVIRLMQDFIQALPAEAPALENLRAVVRWTLEAQLAADMPSLPNPNSSLRATLVANQDYMAGVRVLRDRLSTWIAAAQAAGALNPTLPAIAILYTFYVRACDPGLAFLRMDGLYQDEQIVDMVMCTCFDGVNAR